MKFARHLLAVCAFASFALSSGDGKGWVLLQPKQGGFRVELPAPPRMTSKVIQIPSGGEIDATEYILAFPGKMVLQVQQATVTSEMYQQQPDDQKLNGVANGYCKMNDAFIVSQTSTKIQGCSALVLMLKHDDILIRGFTVVVGDRNYLVLAGAKKDLINSDTISRF